MYFIVRELLFERGDKTNEQINHGTFGTQDDAEKFIRRQVVRHRKSSYNFIIEKVEIIKQVATSEHYLYEIANTDNSIMAGIRD